MTDNTPRRAPQLALSCLWVAGANHQPIRDAAIATGARVLRPLLVAAHDGRQPAALRLRATAVGAPRAALHYRARRMTVIRE